jgi:7-alpha-hydroxysteroid dehydrogenase
MILDRFKLDGRVVVVTGSGRGIGRAVAVACAEAGAEVVCSARTREQVDDTVAQIESFGGRALALTCDVTDEAQRAALPDQAIEKFGRLDVLVNNVGGWLPQPALETSDKDFEQAFRFNVLTAFSLTRTAVPKMVQTAGSGAVINISSVAGIEPWPAFSAYGTAKAAMNFLTKEMAQDFAPKVRVNAIACGSIETDALASILDDDLRHTMESMTPMARIGRVEDIAACAVYLASPASSYVTGEIVGVNGGLNGLNMSMPRADL